MRKKSPINFPLERVVLSDVLPYETPITFSNRYFFEYLVKRVKKPESLNREIEKILFRSSRINTPFSFNISHKKHDYRELKIIHPVNQCRVIDFYKEYSDLILYYCSISPFSIRKPHKVASYSFYNDELHKKNKDGDLEHSQIEQDKSEYSNLKSYFTYYKYSNIHKFYESYQFHRSEKKFDGLLKIDVSKCFDSIYTHTVSWALFNKGIIKENIDLSRKTFGGKFDELMQQLNANETNGIVIGPEFSRIFAEIILQQIDVNILNRLKRNDGNKRGLIHKVDYEIFRYVDDYFVFFNNEEDLIRIKSEFKLALKEYKMHLNEQKSIIYGKPIITEISLAKQKISDLFVDNLVMKINSDDSDKAATMYFSSNNVITRFKSIIKETGINYQDIMNYTLAVLDKKTSKVISKFNAIHKDERTSKIEQEIEKGLLEILDVTFFFYSVSPKVNSTIKVCLIINKIIRFLKRNKTNNHVEPLETHRKHTIFKKISDEIFLILEKNKSQEETQIESLYLLIALSQLGREYRLNKNVLYKYFSIQKSGSGKLQLNEKLNYFSITVLLWYIKDIKAYDEIKNSLKILIFTKFKNSLKSSEDWRADTELVLLLLDTLTCPYLNNQLTLQMKNKLEFTKLHRSARTHRDTIREALNFKYKFKKDLLSLLGIEKDQIKVIEQERFWFTKWFEFDMGMELQAKRSQEVY